MNAMQPTRVRLLVGVAVIATALGWGVVQVVDAWFGRLVPVPWAAAAALWFLAGAVAYWAFTSRPRLRHLPGAKPMPRVLTSAGTPRSCPVWTQYGSSNRTYAPASPTWAPTLS